MIGSPAFKLLLGLLALLSAFLGGWWLGAQLVEGAHARLEVKQRSAVIDGLLADRERERGINARLQLKLDASLNRASQDKTKFDRRLRDATENSLVACGPATGPGDSHSAGGDRGPGGGSGVGDRVAFSLDFVGLWNDALCIGAEDEAVCAAGRNDPAFGAGFALPKDILANLAENAGRCAIDRARLGLWQAWAREQGLVP